jgi:hypothetical protein
MEAAESNRFIETLTAQLRPVLFTLDRTARAANLAKTALRVFKSFTLSVGLEGSVTLGVDPERGVGDSGDLPSDLTSLLVAVGQAAAAEDSAVLIAVDEVQYVAEDELAAMIVAVHRLTQLALPVILVGTGLPQLPALAGNAKSYAERLFNYPKIGALTETDAGTAIQAPAHAQNVEFTTEALNRIFVVTQGYPYFLQEWAYHVWNRAERSPVTIDDVNRAENLVLERLDESFFRVRYDRLTPRERVYLRAMAELGAGPHRSGDIANILNVKVESLSPLRNGLIRKGMAYSPQHGDTAFTVPLFDQFMRRTMPDLPSRVEAARPVK